MPELLETASSLIPILVAPVIVAFATLFIIDRWLWYRFGTRDGVRAED